jgi:hypothetical protein
MARKFTKVLALMETKGGRVDVTDSDLNALLGKLMYRVASYMSAIRRRGGKEVRAIRNGRKVVAYELVASAGSSADVAAPATDENV